MQIIYEFLSFILSVLFAILYILYLYNNGYESIEFINIVFVGIA